MALHISSPSGPFLEDWYDWITDIEIFLHWMACYSKFNTSVKTKILYVKIRMDLK
jgi:hypothetical protein